MRFRLLFALLAAPAVLAAQATVTVPVQDPVYRDLDRLFGAGVIKTMVVGMRPYSRREIARIVNAASQRPAWGEQRMSESNGRILQRLAREFAPEIAALRGDSTPLPRFTINQARVEALGTNSASRPIPDDSTGYVAADLNPLLNGRAGRVLRPGVNLAGDVDASFRVSRSLILRADPRLVTNLNAGNGFAQGSLEAASVTGLWHNVMAEVGRQQFVWGQGMEGGMLGSTSSRPLDMVRLNNDTTFYLWPLGPARAEIVVMDLGPNQTFPHSNIVAYKLAGNPFFSRFEFSASVLSEQGGSGAPTASAWDYFIDIIPALKYTRTTKNNTQFSNKFAGFDYRLRLPELSGLQLYAEHQFDDMDSRRWKSTLWQDAGHIFGFSFAQLGQSDFTFTGEFHHTGIRYYKHRPFTTGIAFNRTLLGDPLGPKGDGGYARLGWDAGRANSFTIDGSIERRLGDLYTAVVDGVAPHETNFRFVVIEPKPNEWRHRIVGTWQYRPDAHWRGSLIGGYEKAGNFAFVQDATRNGFLMSAMFEYFQW